MKKQFQKAAKAYDVIILGGGIAGMTAALTMLDAAKSRHAPRPKILLLEGAAEMGGRVKTLAPAGDAGATDLGAHWFHGGTGNSFYKWAEQRYGAFTHIADDPAEKYELFDGTGPLDSAAWRRMDQQLFETYAAYKQEFPGSHPTLETIFKKAGRADDINGYGAYVAQSWMAVTRAAEVDANEFFKDAEAAPGGVQLTDGMKEIVDKMAGELARRGVKLKTHTVVRRVEQHDAGVTVTDARGRRYHADKSIVTSSIASLQNGNVSFVPRQAAPLRRYIRAVQPATATKIIVPLAAGFFDKNNIAPDSRYGFFDKGETFFCFARGAGENNIMLYLGGRRAVALDHASPAAAKDFALKSLDSIPAFKGYRAALAGEPVVTHWNSDPLYQCAYSAMKPGRTRCREGFMEDGNITYAGEAFAPTDAATMKGAWDSGRKAGATVYADLARTSKPSKIMSIPAATCPPA